MRRSKIRILVVLALAGLAAGCSGADAVNTDAEFDPAGTRLSLQRTVTPLPSEEPAPGSSPDAPQVDNIIDPGRIIRWPPRTFFQNLDFGNGFDGWTKTADAQNF